VKYHDGSRRRLTPDVWTAVFNGVSLSPYTRFVDNVQICLGVGAPASEILAVYTRLLNQLNRHLTAYDLVTFHHRGANYPDALLLDALLKTYVGMTAWTEFRNRDDSVAQMRRRALRQACLLRRHYHGHLVPDAPTSPGENARVLPASHPRVPEEQLTQTMRRRKQLFADVPLRDLLTGPAREALALAVADLEHVEERDEMGLGLFIDRPLGYSKAIGEPDQTPLFAHEAFSPAIARRRWTELKKLCGELGIDIATDKLDALFAVGALPKGLPHAELAECPRPVAALADVRKVAADFVILRTLPRGLKVLLDLFDWRSLLELYRLQFLAEGRVRLCVQALDEHQRPVLALFDDNFRRRLEIAIEVTGGFVTRAGMESPRSGLRVVRLCEDDSVAWLNVDVLIPPVV
jgi:hypothetical protein